MRRITVKCALRSRMLFSALRRLSAGPRLKKKSKKKKSPRLTERRVALPIGVGVAKNIDGLQVNDVDTDEKSVHSATVSHVVAARGTLNRKSLSSLRKSSSKFKDRPPGRRLSGKLITAAKMFTFLPDSFRLPSWRT